jgi:uncharacterized secreted protein with C-terminal beta-propeller domain
LDKEILAEGNRWNFYSEAIYNHKAFSYRGSDKVFAMPISETILPEYSHKNELKIYKIENNEINFQKSILGNSESYGYQRSIIFSVGEKSFAIYISNGNFYFDEI